MKAQAVRVGRAVGLCAIAMAVSAARGATASMDITTGTSPNWTVTGGGATNATPAALTGNLISLTSDGTVSGTPITGFNNSSFDGFWTANYAFNLPADATGTTLAYSGLFADDRAIVFLNGKQIADMSSDGPGSGMMVLSDGGSPTPFTFTDNTSGTITTGFNAGSANTLTAVVNNTTSGRNGTLLPLVGTNGTAFRIAGTISFASGSGGNTPAASVPVPPAAWVGLATLLGLTAVGVLRRRPSATHI